MKITEKIEIEEGEKMKLNRIGFWYEIKPEIIKREKDGYDAADKSRRLRLWREINKNDKKSGYKS